jgi:hypothetical protein
MNRKECFGTYRNETCDKDKSYQTCEERGKCYNSSCYTIGPCDCEFKGKCGLSKQTSRTRLKALNEEKFGKLENCVHYKIFVTIRDRKKRKRGLIN